MNYLFINPFFWGVVVVMTLFLVRVVQVKVFYRWRLREDVAKEELPVLEGWVEVKHVVDGDTFRVVAGEEEFLVRLIGVDTPESVHPFKKVECYGVEVAEIVRDAIEGQKVRLEYDGTQGNEDKYGRLLRYVFLENGSNLGRYLIREGLAYEKTYGREYKFKTHFLAAQVFAQVNKLGFWAPAACKNFRKLDLENS